MTRSDREIRVFVIHLALFVVANIGFAALNLMRNPGHIWFIWVLAGWGIGLAAHDLALLLKRTPRREAIFSDPAVRRFFLHAFVYVAVNTLLLVVNLLATPRLYWFYWPLLGWGVALAAHGYVVFRRRGASGKSRPKIPPKSPRPGRSKTGAKK